jgi:hypothetical protein
MSSFKKWSNHMNIDEHHLKTKEYLAKDLEL